MKRTSAIRQPANPITDVTAFNVIVESVTIGNPFGCVASMIAGVNPPPVEKTKENYVTRVAYQDTDAKTVGNRAGKFNTIAGFNAGATALPGGAALTAAHGGTPARGSPGRETYLAPLKCHDPNGELYMVTFSRDRVN